MPRHSGLGRGLGALLGETAGEVLSAEDSEVLREVALSELEPNPDQPRKRFDEDDLASLADSLKQNGVLQPIVVRERAGTYQIVAGERRYQAAKRAGLQQVPVLVRDVTDEELLGLALIENLQRADLNPLEEALGYQALIEQNHLTQAEVGNMLSKSRSAVSNALRLLELPEEAKELLRDGRLSAGHARAVLAVEGDAGRNALARKVVDEGLSVRQTEILAPLFSVKNDAPLRRTPTPESYKRAAKSLRNGLATKVSVRTVRGKHKIEIEFADEDELDRLVEKIVGGVHESA